MDYHTLGIIPFCYNTSLFLETTITQAKKLKKYSFSSLSLSLQFVPELPFLFIPYFLPKFLSQQAIVGPHIAIEIAYLALIIQQHDHPPLLPLTSLKSKHSPPMLMQTNRRRQKQKLEAFTAVRSQSSVVCGFVACDLSPFVGL